MTTPTASPPPVLPSSALPSPALVVLGLALSGIAAGMAAWAAGAGGVAGLAWTLGTLPVLALLAADIVRSLSRGDVGLDLVAALSMTAALAFGEPLAANVVAVMYAGGIGLESYARGRATREMTALLSRVPRSALRHAGGRLEEIAIEAIVPGDRLYVRKGDVVPTDGRLDDGAALLDTAALTGESRPRRLSAGAALSSGATNLGAAFTMTATRAAADSTYAGIVRLVEKARDSKAPVVRLADRLAVWFLLFTLALAGLAWGLTGDRMRALAVLVVATPCPLILALPIAIISGISRAAGRGVLIKHAGALEGLSRLHTAIFDKTGTLTHGRVDVDAIRTADGFAADEVLRLAASLEQASAHVLARAVVEGARRRGLALATPTDVHEDAGAGLSGGVGGRRVALGSRAYLEAAGVALPGEDPGDGARAVVAVAVDGRYAGVLVLADPLRFDAEATLERLRRGGIRRIVLASGDAVAVVEDLGARLRLEAVHGAMTPADKLALVVAEKAHGPVMMVGDGVNDAPALAAADVGVALGAAGTAASAETADVVLLVDELARLAEALAIARRARRIALQSVAAGLGLSVVAMVAAAFGHLTPVAGALLQEAIDVAVIVNALRVLRPGREERRLAG